MYALDITKLPAVGAPVIEYLYKDGESILHRQKFIIPFKLETKDEYLIWLRGVLLEVQDKFGQNEFKYLFTFLREGKEAAEDWLKAQNFTPITAERIPLHCNSISKIIFESGIEKSLWNGQCNLVEGWSNSHRFNFQFDAWEFTRFLLKWGTQLYSDRIKGTLNGEKTLVYYEANSFSPTELFFMESIATHSGEHEEDVNNYFRRLNVTSINLTDRIKDNFPIRSSRYVWFSRAKPNFKNGTENVNSVRFANGECGHCHKPNHDENSCWVKFPHLKTAYQGTKRRAKNNSKGSKKFKNS